MAERISQITLESLVTGEPNTRISQVTPENLVTGVPNTRISQITPEALSFGEPFVRLSQLTPEALVSGLSNVRISQIVLEMLVLNIEVFMPIVYPNLPGLGYSVHWKPKAFNLQTATMQTGARIDLGLTTCPLHDFELTYNFLRGQGFQRGSTEFRKMMGFFLYLNGNLGRFLFPNPDDRSVTRQLIGVTDGTSHVWQLVRTFGVEEYVGTEPVGYVDLTCPFNVYLDDVLQSKSSYSVLTTEPVNQQLDFGYTPTAGQNIYVDMSYFYYCNFPEDQLDFEKFMNNLWLIKSVKFSSNRAGT
jgi:hypothetical protein